MEEKHVPEQDLENRSAEPILSDPEPEAAEVPLIEALTFTSESPEAEGTAPIPPEPGEEAPAMEETPEQAQIAAEQRIPAEAGAVTPPEPAAPEIPEASGNTPEQSPVTPEAALEDASVDLSILDDPELEEVLYEEEPEEPATDQAFHAEGEDFDKIMDAPAPEQKSPVSERPPRKGRPKRKKGEGLLGIPNILATVVWLALILAIGVTAGRMLWVCAADVLAFGREDKPVTVTIYESDTMDDIIEKLYNGGLIRYRSLFKLYADISNAEEDIDPGIYDLNTRYDYHALVNMMSASSSRTVVEGVLIPEGYTCRQIFSLLEEKRVCTAQDLAAYAANGELKDYWFLENVERGDQYCLEGFLFPDTYDFYKNSTPREVLEKLLDNFEVRFDDEMRAQIETLNANVTDGSFTVREVAIVASMIEKEAAAPSEAPNIAGVIYNRLFRWDGTPAYLNIDASIIYALGGKSDLTREDLQVDSPFNTYTHTGLTPTPIANPGLSSLKAALSPASHNYYYYVLNPETGMHAFSTTYEEHSANVAAYAEGQ